MRLGNVTIFCDLLILCISNYLPSQFGLNCYKIEVIVVVLSMRVEFSESVKAASGLCGPTYLCNRAAPQCDELPRSGPWFRPTRSLMYSSSNNSHVTRYEAPSRRQATHTI